MPMVLGEEIAREVFREADPAEQKRISKRLSQKAKRGAKKVKDTLVYDGQFRAKKILGLWRYDPASFHDVGENKSKMTNMKMVMGGRS